MFGIGRLKLYLRKRNIRKVHHIHYSKNNTEYSAIDKIVEKYRNVGGLVNDYQSYKLYSLVRLLKRYKPKKILEFGSGTTTAVFADWVKANNGVSLVSVDESTEWITKSSSLAGIAEDDARFKMVSAPKIVEELQGGLTGARYNMPFDGNFDFVLVDGPSLNVDGVKRKDTINTDIFKLTEFSSPQVIVVDIRVATVNAMMKKLNNYNLFLSDLIWKPNPEGLVSDQAFGVRPGYRYFSYFEKK
jgi:hypothetical protein